MNGRTDIQVLLALVRSLRYEYMQKNQNYALDSASV